VRGAQCVGKLGSSSFLEITMLNRVLRSGAVLLFLLSLVSCGSSEDQYETDKNLEAASPERIGEINDAIFTVQERGYIFRMNILNCELVKVSNVDSLEEHQKLADSLEKYLLLSNAFLADYPSDRFFYADRDKLKCYNKIAIRLRDRSRRTVKRYAAGRVELQAAIVEFEAVLKDIKSITDFHITFHTPDSDVSDLTFSFNSHPRYAELAENNATTEEFLEFYTDMEQFLSEIKEKEEQGWKKLYERYKQLERNDEVDDDNPQTELIASHLDSVNAMLNAFQQFESVKATAVEQFESARDNN
jgi:hypothetical protein